MYSLDSEYIILDGHGKLVTVCVIDNEEDAKGIADRYAWDNPNQTYRIYRLFQLITKFEDVDELTSSPKLT